MHALVLAAGYATRLYPLTRDRPKPLLPVGGRPLLDHLLDELRRIPGFSELWIVTNHRFFDAFTQWSETVVDRTVRILDDGTTDNEGRLGAVADLALVLEEHGVPEEGLCVCAGDNLVRFPLVDGARAYRDGGKSTIVVLEEKDPARLRRTGVVELDDRGRVVSFEEKPAEPRSTLTSPAFYFLSARSLRRVPEYLERTDVSRDAPGHFIAWLTATEEVRGAVLPGGRVDIGCLEDYEAVR